MINKNNIWWFLLLAYLQTIFNRFMSVPKPKYNKYFYIPKNTYNYIYYQNLLNNQLNSSDNKNYLQTNELPEKQDDIQNNIINKSITIATDEKHSEINEENTNSLAPYMYQGIEDSIGLLEYKKWWWLRPVEVSIYGEILNGTPIFIRNGTIRLINENDSYFIPLNKITYIKTVDGLE